VTKPADETKGDRNDALEDDIVFVFLIWAKLDLEAPMVKGCGMVAVGTDGQNMLVAVERRAG
jgi:hypothetical protein